MITIYNKLWESLVTIIKTETIKNVILSIKLSMYMRYFFQVLMIFLLPLAVVSQHITYSDPLKEDLRDINFEIIGKVNSNYLVFKNIRLKYAITVYNSEMQFVDKVALDFLPDKTYNVDFVTFPEYFYLVYQYQKKGVVHCLAVKMDSKARRLNEPVELDTTQVGLFGDNKIYNLIASDDHKKIMVFKMQKKNAKLNFVTLLKITFLIYLLFF